MALMGIVGNFEVALDISAATSVFEWMVVLVLLCCSALHGGKTTGCREPPFEVVSVLRGKILANMNRTKPSNAKYYPGH
eukprot:4952558-Amphidinium_carterae.1